MIRLKKEHSNSQQKIEEIEKLVASNDAEVVIYENPVSYPVETAQVDYNFQGGLIDSKTLQLIKEATLLRHNRICQAMPEWNYDSLEISRLPKIEGTFLFGGILLNNFGHFLLESISRLWAYDMFKKFDPYILFYAPWGIPDYLKKNNHVHQVFKGFDIPLKRLIFFKEIIKLQRVIIPEQKYGFGKCRTPNNAFINFIKKFNFRDQLPKAFHDSDKIYVSRSGLSFSQGRPFGETLFETYLQANGYRIIYPEKHTLYEQLAIYKQAKRIIFCDGGAVYSTILLPELSAEVAIVARRRDSRWNYKEVVTEHFNGYNKTVLWIDEVVGQYQYGLETWDAAGEIDWYKVSLLLKKENFVLTAFENLDTTKYADIKRNELQQYIQSIHTNPIFLDYMQKQQEQYPIMPLRFPE